MTIFNLPLPTPGAAEFPARRPSCLMAPAAPPPASPATRPHRALPQLGGGRRSAGTPRPPAPPGSSPLPGRPPRPPGVVPQRPPGHGGLARCPPSAARLGASGCHGGESPNEPHRPAPSPREAAPGLPSAGRATPGPCSPHAVPGRGASRTIPPARLSPPRVRALTWRDASGSAS